LPAVPWAELTLNRGKRMRGRSEVAAKGMISVTQSVAISTVTAAQRLTAGLPGSMGTKSRMMKMSMPIPKPMRTGLDAAGGAIAFWALGVLTGTEFRCKSAFSSCESCALSPFDGII
jgi:hypothetical protein